MCGWLSLTLSIQIKDDLHHKWSQLDTPCSIACSHAWKECLHPNYFQSDLSPARSSSVEAQDFSITLHLTPPLIPSPSEEINKTYDVPFDLSLDLEWSTLYLSVFVSNPANNFPSYESDTIAQANSSYFCLPLRHTPAEIKGNKVVVKKENSLD